MKESSKFVTYLKKFLFIFKKNAPYLNLRKHSNVKRWIKMSTIIFVKPLIVVFKLTMMKWIIYELDNFRTGSHSLYCRWILGLSELNFVLFASLANFILKNFSVGK